MTEEQRLKRNAYMRDWCARNKEKCNQRARDYAASHRKEAIERVRLWRIKNKERWLARLRGHYAKNSATIRQKQKKYYDKFKGNLKWHKRRALLENAHAEDCTKKIALLQLERFCRWCCTALTDANRTIDHIIPFNRGGHHIEDNLAACCRRCNFSRGDKMIHEWLPFQEFHAPCKS